MNFVRSSNGDVVTFRYSPNNQITFSSESVVALTATVVYEGATLVDSVFGAIPANWKDGNPDITQLTLGTSATSIGDYAFSSCTSLSGSLTIPNNVTSIGIGAFRSTVYSSLTLGSSVTSIGSYAFSYCGNLTGPLTIPNSVTSIGTYAFRESGWDAPTAFTYPLTIPGTVSLASYAFYGASFNGLNVTGTSIAFGQFYLSFNTGAPSVIGPLTIANTVTSIGDYAFKDYSGFTGSLIIPNSVTSIGSSAFYYCSGFTGSLTIGSSVASIDNSAFQNCTGFTGDLTIPNSVTSIGSSAFENCSGLTTVLCYVTKDIIDGGNKLNGTSITTIRARATDGTWTAGAGQTVGSQPDITVIKDL
jgi:hypothetical protein